MNGAESLLQTLVSNGIEVCFTNPGTSEMHFVAALDEVEGMRCVLCLFEGVLSGAAHGYAVMAGKPASTLLHLGPGLGNALANLHNAKKGDIPIVNIIGDHATYHLQYNAPLTSDIGAISSAVSHWTYTSQSASDIAKDTANAIAQAGIGKVATLILPADVSWGDNPNGAEGAVPINPAKVVSKDLVDGAVTRLQSDKKCMIMIGGRKITKEQGLMLSKLSKATDARICTEVFPSRISRGSGSAVIERLPYIAEMAIDHIKDIEHLILIGAKAPVSFFAYPNVPSTIAPDDCEIFTLAGPNDDIDQLLQKLIDRIGAGDKQPDVYPLNIPELPGGPLNAQSAATTIAHFIPDNAIIVDEAITSGMPIFPMTMAARPHDWLNLTGGSIGWGLPAAVGAAIASPDRKVICLEGDGSAMYTIQALWTMARENLDILVVIFNNRKYSILEMEFMKTGARGGVPGPNAASTLAIGNPDLDFVSMAQGMGVSATRATTAEEFNEQMKSALENKGPHLIDAVVPTLF
ncbi:MAG: acetolactate synthase large subunit [Bacteroidia bacterium]|nr:acetolactate synthase large subunit [Bacteroidia bacterium]